MSWREQLKVHEAADMFPLMSEAELCALAEDIKKNGLRQRVALIIGDDGEPILLDGRNRLDAMARIGPIVVDEKVAMRPTCQDCAPDFDPYAYVISANIHRRHLTAEQRRDLIAKLVKATPEKSDRQIAETVKASPTTVGKVRAEMEPTVQSGQLKRVGKDGKARKMLSPEELRARREERKRLRRGGGSTFEEEMAAHDATMAQDDPESSAEARKRVDPEVYAEAEEEKVDQRAFLITCGASVQAAKHGYAGEVNVRVLDACDSVLRAWTALHQRLANRRFAERKAKAKVPFRPKAERVEPVVTAAPVAEDDPERSAAARQALYAEAEQHLDTEQHEGIPDFLRRIVA